MRDQERVALRGSISPFPQPPFGSDFPHPLGHEPLACSAVSQISHLPCLASDLSLGGMLLVRINPTVNTDEEEAVLML